MSLFLNASNLHSHQFDCEGLDVSETIERDCLSVLHKLHDQVNGLQLVQVVVQPMARLFNPTSLATMIANVSTPNTIHSSNTFNPTTTTPPTTPSSHQPTAISIQPNLQQQNVDFDSHSYTTPTTNSSSLLSPPNQTSHSRTQSFNSATGNNLSSSYAPNTPTSTYMMSPDTAQALIARLDTDRDVNWLMEIIGYGLSMPFALTGEQDSVKDCCTIYCEWLTAALLPYNEQIEDIKYQQLSKLVPVPIKKDPNRYARKMLSHLYNIFLPRQPPPNVTSANQKDQSDAILTAVSRQAVLCHRVLRTIENISHSPVNLMDTETWEHMLALLLTVNDKQLSPPAEPDSIGTQLQDRTLSVLFELMLLASSKSIPSPGLWKAFHEMCLNWRHRPALVDQWGRISLMLTKRIVALSMSETSADMSLPSNRDTCSPQISAIETALTSMSYDVLSQTLYRYLNLIGNPVDLTNPDIISRTDEFYRAACVSDNVLDPRQHPCLSSLPSIFMNSITNLKEIIETFLGTYECQPDERGLEESMKSDKIYSGPRGSIISLGSGTVGSPPTQQSAPMSHLGSTTPTQTRRAVIKSIGIKGGKGAAKLSAGSNSNETSTSVTNRIQIQAPIAHQQLMQPRPSLTSLSSRGSHRTQQSNALQFKLYPDRPKCNSILNLFGEWLFNAALIGSELAQKKTSSRDHDYDGTPSFDSSSTTTETSSAKLSFPQTNERGRVGLNQQQVGNTSARDSFISRHDASPYDSRMTLDAPLSVDSFELGQAEAMSLLCKILCSKTTGDEVSPNYLTKFYLCIQHCLLSGAGNLDGKQIPNGIIKQQLLASVLMNSTSLLQKDLDGINQLVPTLIKAIEFIFECSDKDVPIQPPPRQHNRRGSARTNVNNQASLMNTNVVTNYDLRRSSILLLINLLSYPFHFKDLTIRNCHFEACPTTTTTFLSLRPRLLKLLFVALQTDVDPTNMQLLFGGLATMIQDLASNAGKSSLFNPDGTLKSNCKQDSIRPSLNNSTSNDSASNSLDTSGIDDDTASQNSFVFNSSGGLIVKSLHVTCHLLINVWKHDTQVSLAALELLTTIARVSTPPVKSLEDEIDNNKCVRQGNNNNGIYNPNEMVNEYKQATKWICDYISNQCSRPPPAHSRDMHSTIVAAYQCLSVWIYYHPYLLNDGSSVNTLMEAVELGVSGQKSRISNPNSSGDDASETVISKADKIMRPSSIRVREAAELLLNSCMIGARLSPDGEPSLPPSHDTAFNEQLIAELYGGSEYKSKSSQVQNQEQRRLEAYKLFRYFSDDDQIILGLFDGQDHDESTRDSVICLIRAPFGRHCWRMKFNYYTERSRDKIIANKTLGLIKRPFQVPSPTLNTEIRIFNLASQGQHKSMFFNPTAKFFPPSIESIPMNELDRNVTTLEQYVQARISTDGPDCGLEKFARLLSNQISAEQKISSECLMQTKRVQCEEPQPAPDLDTARMFVAQMGLKCIRSSSNINERVTIDFVKEMDAIDQLPIRSCDVINIFYIRRNKTSAREILDSAKERHDISQSFRDWFEKLGHPIRVRDHPHQTKKAIPYSDYSSTGVPHLGRSEHDSPETSDLSNIKSDGDRMTLQWSDVCQELSFVVKHNVDRGSSVQLGLQFPKDHTARICCNTNFIVCWLESSEDLQTVPSEALISACESGYISDDESQGCLSAELITTTSLKLRDHVKYFISSMKSGLYKINVTTSFGHHWMALPLVDGMTVSESSLSGLIRESILNLCRRRRLDADSYQPPHVKRRLKIQDVCNSRRAPIIGCFK